MANKYLINFFRKTKKQIYRNRTVNIESVTTKPHAIVTHRAQKITIKIF